MELTDSLKTLLIETAKALTGSARRLFSRWREMRACNDNACGQPKVNTSRNLSHY